MTVRFAFVGFRHPHIFDMYQRCRAHENVEIVACCEAHAATRDQLRGGDEVDVTYQDHERLLEEADCDVIAVGDAYGRRAGIILAALQAGKHVISDKPLCISLEELDQIQRLAINRITFLYFGCARGRSILNNADNIAIVIISLTGILAPGGDMSAKFAFIGSGPFAFGAFPLPPCF